MITSLYAALLGLLLVALSAYVIMGRRQFKIGAGTGDKPEMMRRIRAQGNYTEYTPFFLILLWIAEYNGMSAIYLHILGATFVVGRLIHAYGILFTEQYQKGQPTSGMEHRIRGMALTFTVIGILCAILLYQYATSLERSTFPSHTFI